MKRRFGESGENRVEEVGTARIYTGGKTVFTSYERLEIRMELILDLPQLQTIRAYSIGNLTHPRKVVLRSRVG